MRKTYFFALLFILFAFIVSCSKENTKSQIDDNNAVTDADEIKDSELTEENDDKNDLHDNEMNDDEIVEDDMSNDPDEDVFQQDEEKTDNTDEENDSEFPDDEEFDEENDEDVAEIELTINFISVIETGVSVSFSGIAKGIDNVKVIRDDKWEFYSGKVTDGTYSFTYSFNTAGSAEIFAKGYDLSGKLLKTVKKNITIKNPDPGVPYLENVPYFYQYSNSINPGGSCQNTSMAMVLKYFGAKVTPDEISNYYGTSKAQTVSGWKEVFDSEAKYFGLPQRSTSTDKGTLTNLRTLLTNKKPVVVHGYFTSYGHVVLLLGYDGTYYYAHDPAGKWNQVYQGGGYSGVNSTEGKYIKYGKTALEQAVAPDGNVWMHSF